ncbi:MAG: TatD family hydrolase [Candidatus Cloacimonadota bacterium]|nr:TatD family hydrolase [Candidatus Cloacimonadota bacterium]
MLTDIHCHLFDLHKKELLREQLTDANKIGIKNHISVALTNEEVDFHLKNKQLFTSFYAGIHPKYINQAEINIDRIVTLCAQKQIVAIGEIGLDKRFEDIEKQNKILLIQLEIAKEFNLPVVFHNVKMYYELSKLIRDNFPQTRGILHSFNGSVDIFSTFKKMDFAFSINCRFQNYIILQQIISWGRFFIETDAPYQKPATDNSEINSLKNLLIPYNNLIKSSSEDIINRGLQVNNKYYFEKGIS